MVTQTVNKTHPAMAIADRLGALATQLREAAHKWQYALRQVERGRMPLEMTASAEARVRRCLAAIKEVEL